MHPFPSNSASDNGGNANNTLTSEIDYGDIPENMDEQAMRKYLDMESNLVMPNAKKKDSFEAEWTSERQKLNKNMSQGSNRFVMVNGTNKQSSSNVFADPTERTDSGRVSQISRVSTQTSATEYS